MFYISDLPVRGMDALVGADGIRALCTMLMVENKKTVSDALGALEKVKICQESILYSKCFSGFV